MQQLLEQLGIDWHLLISQAVNFGLLFIVLRLVVYKPLLKLLHDRRMRIEEGITKADEADKRLLEVEEIGKGKLKAAEAEALGILKKTEVSAKELEERMLADAKRKEAEERAAAAARLAAQDEEARLAMAKEAATMVRRAIAKTVELAPEKIDDALIAKAVEEARKAA